MITGEVRGYTMKKIPALFLAIILMLSAAAALADEFRRMPIDLTGGAPYPKDYQSLAKKFEYEDPTIKVERFYDKNPKTGIFYYGAKITIKDGSQLRTACADDKSFVSTTKVPAKTMAKRKNAILAINGDYCANFGEHMKETYILRQGTVYKDKVNPDLDVLLVDEDGDFHVLPCETDLESADLTTIDGKKVYNAFQFGPALVIDGQPVNDEKLLDRKHSPALSEPDYNNRRTCICQLGPREYMVLITNHINLPNFRDLVMSIADCQTVYELDGGNSASLIFLGRRIDTENKERSLPDIIYFASAWFED